MTTSIPTVPRSKISMLKDRVITDLNSRIFKLEAIIKVLVRKTNGGVVDKLEFSEDFPNLSIEFCDQLNKEFLEMFESRSCSSGLDCSDLDIDEDADEVKYTCIYYFSFGEVFTVPFTCLLQEQFRMKLEKEEMLLFKEERILEEESRLILEKEARPYETGYGDLSRCNTSIDNVWLSEDLDLYLGQTGLLRYRFTWCNDRMVNRKFWESLVCLDPPRKGWLLDDHIDLWVEYMWHVRPKSADWAMVSSYFVQLLLQDSMPNWYANGQTYNLPWSAVDQESTTEQEISDEADEHKISDEANEHEMSDEYLTEEQQQQQLLQDEEALRETLEEKARHEKE
ncbi:hypothetical protein Tco_0469619 [Tanacetum coccineum]